MLRDCEIKLSYRSDRDDIAAEFYSPMLRAAVSYDRASGYFTSGMLLFLLPALRDFVPSGLMRLVVSPDLTSEDLDAIERGYIGREAAAIKSAERVVDDFLAAANGDARALLSSLIRTRALDIRIAATRTRGIFHEKIGIFRDGADAVAFTGSLNETAAGFSSNFESIDVYTSWADAERVDGKTADFSALWENRTCTISVVDFTEYLRVRLSGNVDSDHGAHRLFKSRDVVVALRDYQQEAVKAWTGANFHGILDMATGSGKTITALYAARAAIDAGVRSLVILAPLKHLVEQWAEAARFHLDATPIICSSDHEWRPQLKSAIMLSEAARGPIMIISTYMTAESDAFVDLSKRLPNAKMLIADEVHNVTLSSATAILRSDYEFRLGLSATPLRVDDDAGNASTTRYFGGTVFKYSLADAIAGGFLTPYRYIPIFCALSSAEQIEYERLVRELNSSSTSDVAGASLSALLTKRSTLLQNAYDKLVQFERVFARAEIGQEGFALVYCHHDLIDVVMRFIGTSQGVSAHTFTARETMEERRAILSRFETGDLKALVAIRCLDEGVDVPAVRTAFLLNSSSNPREFIQRRGRVLRTFIGKDYATIYDFIVLPSRLLDLSDSILEKEMKRFSEFASLAMNRQEAMLALEDSIDKTRPKRPSFQLRPVGD